MKNKLSRYTCAFVLGNALLFSSSHLLAQSTFKGFNPNWNKIVSGVDRAESLSDQLRLKNEVLTGQIDTRGTRVSVPNRLIEKTSTGRRSVIADNTMRWHNPLFFGFRQPTSSRWYQKDGNTQVFRVFPGDQNLTNGRLGAARSEVTAQDETTTEGDGKKIVFSARYHVAKHNPSRDVLIFQSKARGINPATGREPAWGVALWARKSGDIVLVQRNAITAKKEFIDTGFKVGQSFNLRVADDGYNYEAFINNVKKAEGTWERGNTQTLARWGAYIQAEYNGIGILKGTVEDPFVLFVSGARVVTRPNFK